jgi:hypothetical protein
MELCAGHALKVSVILSPGDGRSVGRCCGRLGGFNLSKKEHLLFIESMKDET